MSQLEEQENSGKIKFSKLRLKSRVSARSKKSNSPRPREKISSYFSSLLNESEQTSKSKNENKKINDSDSTQNSSKSTSTDCISNTPDNEDDFKESKIVKPAKIFDLKSQKNLKPLKKKQIRKINTRSNKNELDLESNYDTNQEHLQLALAMSKSLQDLENPQENNETDYDNQFSNTQQKIARVKQTLDQFGFKTGKASSTLSNFRINIRHQTRKKSTKFFTPTLFLRTEEDRKKIIENKVSQIITNISIYNKTTEELSSSVSKLKDVEQEIIGNKPRSFILRDYYNENAILFKKNSLSLDEMQSKIFYNKTVSPTNVQTGILLKDWCSIPGREKTPPLIIENTNSTIELEDCNLSNIPSNLLNIEKSSTEIILSEEAQVNLNRSMSPDLFSESDSEIATNSSNKIICSSENLTQSVEEVITIPSHSNESIESDQSEKSISLLDSISPKHYKKSPKNKRILQETVLENEEDSSLSPFSPINNFKSPPKKSKNKEDSTKKILFKKSTRKENDDNDSSLSPFELIISNQPKSKTPKTKSSKKSAINRKFKNNFMTEKESTALIEKISPKVDRIRNQLTKPNTSCCKSLTFQNKNHSNEYLPEKEDNVIESTQICLFESFCDDSLPCFDLTKSSDDDSDISSQKNSEISNNKETKYKLFDLTQTSNESKFSAETVVLNQQTDEEICNNDEYSPEFDCLNLTNNKEFYENLNKTYISSSDNEDSHNLKETEKNCSGEIQNKEDICENNQNDALNRKKFADIIFKSKNQSFSIENVEENNKSDHEDRDKSAITKNFNNCSDMIPNDINLTNLLELFNTNNNRKSISPILKASELKNNISSFSRKTFVRSFSENITSTKKLDIDSSKTITYSSDEFEICDEELTYSVNKSNCQKNNYELFSCQSISSDSEDEKLNCFSNVFSKKSKIDKVSYENENFFSKNILIHPRVKDLSTPTKPRQAFYFSQPNVLLEDSFDELLKESEITKKITDDDNQLKVSSPKNQKIVNEIPRTPNSEVIIKTSDVTPYVNYNDMTTPEMNLELERFGLKAMKRTKGVKILKYIYEATHPVIDHTPKKLRRHSSDGDSKIVKRRKNSHVNEDYDIQNQIINFTENLTSIEIVGKDLSEREKLEDMIFERKQYVKISTCPVPLHIVWHNFLSTEKELQEKILLYEPIEVEEIYNKIRALGFKFHIQDLITFLDRKCITIKQQSKQSYEEKV